LSILLKAFTAKQVTQTLPESSSLAFDLAFLAACSFVKQRENTVLLFARLAFALRLALVFNLAFALLG
jgi:hypothetical protein